MKKEPEKNEAVPVPAEDLESLGVERDYTAERNSRVVPFVRDLFASIGDHSFTFASGSKNDITTIDQALQDLENVAPTAAPRSSAEQKKVDEEIARLHEQRDTIEREITEEDQSYDDFYEKRFIKPALEKDLQVNDLNFTFSLANMAIGMLKSVASAPPPGNELRLVPAAQEIIKKLAEEDNLMLTVSEHEDPRKGLKRKELYERLYDEVVVPVFDKYEVKYNEVMQVFGIMSSILSMIQQRTTKTLDGARDIAEAKLWGIEDKDNLTIRQLHSKCVEKDEK